MGVTAEVNPSVTGWFLNQILMTNQSYTPKVLVFVSISYMLNLWVTIKWSFHVNSPFHTHGSQQEILCGTSVQHAGRDDELVFYLISVQHGFWHTAVSPKERKRWSTNQLRSAQCGHPHTHTHTHTLSFLVKEVLFDCSQRVTEAKSVFTHSALLRQMYC